MSDTPTVQMTSNGDHPPPLEVISHDSPPEQALLKGSDPMQIDEPSSKKYVSEANNSPLHHAEEKQNGVSEENQNGAYEEKETQNKEIIHSPPQEPSDVKSNVPVPEESQSTPTPSKDAPTSPIDDGKEDEDEEEDEGEDEQIENAEEGEQSSRACKKHRKRRQKCPPNCTSREAQNKTTPKKSSPAPVKKEPSSPSSSSPAKQKICKAELLAMTSLDKFLAEEGQPRQKEAQDNLNEQSSKFGVGSAIEIKGEAYTTPTNDTKYYKNSWYSASILAVQKNEFGVDMFKIHYQDFGDEYDCVVYPYFFRVPLSKDAIKDSDPLAEGDLVEVAIAVDFGYGKEPVSYWEALVVKDEGKYVLLKYMNKYWNEKFPLGIKVAKKNLRRGENSPELDRRNQMYINTKYLFHLALTQYMKERGTPIQSVPKLGEDELDLFTVFVHTMAFGGFPLVSGSRQALQKILSRLPNFAKNQRGKIQPKDSAKLKEIYVELLYPFESKFSLHQELSVAEAKEKFKQVQASPKLKRSVDEITISESGVGSDEDPSPKRLRKRDSEPEPETKPTRKQSSRSPKTPVKKSQVPAEKSPKSTPKSAKHEEPISPKTETKSETNQPLLDAGGDAIQQWLDGIKMGQYISNFLTNGYDDLTFYSHLQKEDLQQIGINLVGHQTKILHYARQLKLCTCAMCVTPTGHSTRKHRL